MNAKTNSIGCLPATNSALRVQGLDGPVPRVALAHTVWIRSAALSARPQLGIGWHSADDQAGEFWETLSYAVIWLCGLIGIGFCFL